MQIKNIYIYMIEYKICAKVLRYEKYNLSTNN